MGKEAKNSWKLLKSEDKTVQSKFIRGFMHFQAGQHYLLSQWHILQFYLLGQMLLLFFLLLLTLFLF